MNDTLRWTFKLILIVVVVVFVIYRLRASYPDNKNPVTDPPDGAAFQFVRDRPWVRMKIGSITHWALFDTGATFSTISRDWLKRADAKFLGMTNTNGVLGSSQLQWATVKDIEFAHRIFQYQQVASSSSSTSVLGASIIFQLPHLLLSKQGLSYGTPINNADSRIVECMAVTMDRNGQNSEVTAAYLHMNINGTVQPVLLDTGAAFLLVGTASDLPKEDMLLEIPRYNLFQGNGGSYGFVKYYSRTAKVSVGDVLFDTNYKSFPSLSRNGVKYYLGASILDRFDIYIDYQQGRACFLKRDEKIAH